MVYSPTFTIKINHSCYGKYTVIPWIRHGYEKTVSEMSISSIGSLNPKTPTKSGPMFSFKPLFSNTVTLDLLQFGAWKKNQKKTSP